MIVSTARLNTANGSKYLQQLSKHFAHKIEVTFDESSSSAQLAGGKLEMQADASGLSFRIESEDAKSLIGARHVVDSHLVNFAFRENFMGLSWAIAE